MNRYFRPTARHVNLQGTAKTSLPAFLWYITIQVIFKNGTQTLQLLRTQKHSSSSFLNLTYCDAIISNITGRQGSEFYLGIQTKGVWMGMLLTQIRKLKSVFIQLHL